MYTGYFGLTEAPFAISPNPRYLYMSELHREALAHLLYGIRSDGCMILLTGDVGTGKTTLCRCLLEQLPENTEVAVILNPRLTARELLKTICEEFGLLPEHATGSIKTYIDAINAHLLRAHANDRTIAIIIDEAQNLAVDVLEQLRLLTNLETPTRKLLRILLLGQPELRDMLERPELSQVNQRITSRFHLGPLQPDDIRAYIQHRLNVAGDHSTTLFSEKAIRHAISLTGGIPRLINVLCDRALLGAYAVNTDHVDLEIMKQAGEEIFPNAYKKERRKRKAYVIAGIIGMLLAVPTVVFLPDLLQQERDKQAPAITTQKMIVPSREEPTSTPAEQPQQQVEVNQPEPESIDSAESESAATETIAQQTDSQVEPNTSPEKETAVIEAEVEFEAEPMPAPQPEQAKEKQDVTIQDKPETEPPVNVKPESPPEPLPKQPAPKVIEEPATTIRISTPLVVLIKAGSTPQKTVMELIAR